MNSLRIFSKNQIKKHCLFCNKRQFNTTPSLNLFWEKNDKGGDYRDMKKLPPFKERMREGLKDLKQEVNLWKEEIKEEILSDPVMIFRPGETDIQWQFGNEEALTQWNVSSDSDHGEGDSNCSLSLTNNGMGLFSGVLSNRVPKDGKVKRSGYCNIKTLRSRKSFKRESFYDWHNYNTLVLRVRGDGRSYMLNIGLKGYFDVTWFDVYHYILYTRGGPYWQVTRIPFSKFFLSSKGRIQDNQEPLNASRVTSFGISIGDKIDGPFSLEIDYIGVENDINHKEEFAYEMYNMPTGIVNT